MLQERTEANHTFYQNSTLTQFLLRADSKSVKDFKYTPNGIQHILKNFPEWKPTA